MDLRNALEELNKRKEDAIKAYPAKLGDGMGHVVAGPGIVYVRIGNIKTIAACTSVPPIHDLDVWIGYDRINRSMLQVLGQRQVTTAQDIQPSVAAHAAMHELFGPGSSGGTDVVKIHLQQFTPLAVWPYQGLKVMIWPGVAWINGSYKLIADLNEYGKPVPKVIDFSEYGGPAANKEMFYLVGLDNDGNIQVVNGAQVDLGSLTLANIPSVPDTMLYALAAIRRKFDQNAIVINRESTDIVDLRFPIAHHHNNLYYTKSMVNYLIDNISAGGAGGIYWYVDGALSQANSVYAYVVPAKLVLKKVFIALISTGSSGETQVDINKNAMSIFPAPLSIPYNHSSGVISQDINVNLQPGDILTLDIDQAADGAADMAVTFDSSPGSAGNNLGETFHGDIIPDNTGSLSDEFVIDTLSNWIELDFNNTTSWNIQNGYLRAQQSWYNNENRAGLVKEIPSGDFTIETHVYLSTSHLKYRSAGLEICENLTSSGRVYSIDLCFDNTNGEKFKTDVLQLNNHLSWQSTIRQLKMINISHAYYRICRSGTTYHFMYSDNGIGWLKMWSGTLSFTPTYFGLSIGARGDNGDPCVAFFEYFRYWNSFLDITDTSMPSRKRLNIIG